MESMDQHSQTDLDDADRLTYFQTVYEGYRRAESAAGGALTRHYNVAGHPICLRFAGPALLSHLTPALAHLESSPATTPALTICLWDSASTQTPMPLLAASLIKLLRLRWWELLDGRREIRGYSSARIRTTFHLGPDILSLLDTTTNTAIYWVEDARQLPYYARAHPLQTLLNWWAERFHCYYMHAAAVGTATGGVLLAGPGGSGKSTTTLACLEAGLGIASDDYVLVKIDPAPYVYSIYSTAKLRTLKEMGNFPELMSRLHGDMPEEENPIVFLHEHYAQAVLRGFPICAILLPHIQGGRDTWVRKATAVAALKALAPSTLLQMSGTGQSAFHVMSSLVKRIPCYTLELGTDLGQIPDVISRLLREIS